MKILSIAEGSHAPAAGIEAGDRIVAIDGVPVRTLADIRLQLLGRRPGDRVGIAVLRGHGASARLIDLDVMLK
jgi:S1-C subfamily serine protease